MKIYEDRIEIGRAAAERAFASLLSTALNADAIERAAYVNGMQSFCREQLKRELISALDPDESPDSPGGALR